MQRSASAELGRTTGTNRTKSIWRYSLKRQKVLEVREGQTADCPQVVESLIRELGIDQEEQEHFLSIILDTKHHVKGYFIVSIGLLDRSQVHARECFRSAILQGAARIVLAHNHPSGDPTPSAQDISSTRNLVAAGKIIGIEVLDHVIVGQPNQGRRGYVSFREEGLI